MSYSHVIQQLSEQYYKRGITFDQYRASRKDVLEKIDQEYNGVTKNETAPAHNFSQVPYDASYKQEQEDDNTMTFKDNTQRKE